MNPLLDWPELAAFIILIAGLFAALFAGSPQYIYAICFLMGLVFGRFWFKLKLTNRIQVFISIVTFFLGIVLVSFYTNVRLSALLLLAGIVIGYELHERGIVKPV